MNPLRLYDYIYYCIAILYDRVFGYSESREEQGIIFLSLIQLSNVLFLIHLVNLKDFAFKKNGVFTLIAIYLVLVGLNFIRYKRFVNLENLEVKFDNQNRKIRHVKILLVINFVILSFALLGL